MKHVGFWGPNGCHIYRTVCWSGPPSATALMLASLHGHEDVVRRLLWTQSADAQLAKRDSKGRRLGCFAKEPGEGMVVREWLGVEKIVACSFKKEHIVVFFGCHFQFQKRLFGRFLGCLETTLPVSLQSSLGLDEFQSWKLTETEVFNIPYHLCMVYLPAFGWFLW